MPHPTTSPNQTPLPTKPWWQKWQLILIAAAIIFYLVSIILRLLSPAQAPELETNQWFGTHPGISNVAEIEQTLGPAVSVTDNPQGSEYSFTPDFESARTQSVITDETGTILFIKEFTDPDQPVFYSEIAAQYGERDFSLQDSYFGPSTSVYVHLKAGVAFSAHLSDGRILQQWYFVPTSAEDFMNKWGQTLEVPTPQGPEEVSEDFFDQTL